jgi:ribosomal-protein-alanine N-acetyltransferase
METLIPHLFSHGLSHLTADVDPRNAGSIKGLLALGFHRTHEARNTFLIGGKWFDSVYFRRDPAA